MLKEEECGQREGGAEGVAGRSAPEVTRGGTAGESLVPMPRTCSGQQQPPTRRGFHGVCASCTGRGGPRTAGRV